MVYATTSSQIYRAGLATIGLAGAGGIGTVFGALVLEFLETHH
jgi:hypothetical protein